jgi:type VI secretion system secreted protein Hcp
MIAQSAASGLAFSGVFGYNGQISLHLHMQTSRPSAATVGLTLCVATSIALAVVLLKNAVQTEPDVVFAAPSGVNTVINDIDLEIFLRVDGITGESSEEGHKNDVLVDSYSFGASRNPSAATPTMQDFLVTMPANKASAKLMVYAAGSVNVPRVVLSVRRKGANVDFMKWTLTDAFVSSYKTVGNLHGDGVQDQVGIAFGKIEAEYRQILPDGTYGAPVKSGWDRRSNKPVPVK